MVCPVAKKAARQDRPTDYPFEPLYRPWSWIISSFSNILLFAILFAVLYIMYRQRKSKSKRTISYRTVETKKTEVLESEGKINALVTGGSEMLGKEIVRGLLEDGRYRVYSLDLTIPEIEDRNNDVYTYIQGDIMDTDSLRLALKDIEVVFHTAAIIPNFVGFTSQDFYDIIATGTENVVSMCKECGVKRLIYTSSIATMLSKDHNQVVEGLDESIPYPKQSRDAYGGAKVIAEKCVLGENGKNGILTCALRLSGLVSSKTLTNWSTVYFGDGSVRHQLIPVDTAARVHILVEKKLQSEGADSLVAGKAYIVSFEDTYLSRELAEFVASKKGKDARSLPIWLFKLFTYFNEYVYKMTGKAIIDSRLRIDMIPYMEKTHTYSSALGRKEIGWEDKRTWKDVLCEVLEETSESKKDK